MRNLILMTVLLAAYGILVLLIPEVTVSPGDLIEGHEKIANDCTDCHSPFRGTPAAKCIACHDLEAIGLLTTAGAPIATADEEASFHQALIEPACVRCHSDHRGAERPGASVVFSHELVRNDLLSTCPSCHGASTPKDDLHRQVGDDCGSCHGFEAWTPATFEHERYFRFDRHHPASECQSCHPNTLDQYTCYGCHEHSARGIAREHREEGITEFEACVECHRSGDEDEAERRFRSRRGNRHDDD